MTRQPLILVATLLCCSLVGCAWSRRHPVVVGAAIGVIGGSIAAGLTAHECEHYPPGYNGVGVDCPKSDKFRSKK